MSREYKPRTLRDPLERLMERSVRNELTGCLEYTGCRNPAGYGLSYYQGRKISSHRLMFLLAVGPLEDGDFVLHRCDNPPCMEPSHLFAGSPGDNMRDMVAKGRNVIVRVPQPGESNGSSKLTELQVEQIRRMLARGETQRSIALIFGVTQSSVSNIKTGKRWL